MLKKMILLSTFFILSNPLLAVNWKCVFNKKEYYIVPVIITVVSLGIIKKDRIAEIFKATENKNTKIGQIKNLDPLGYYQPKQY